MPYPPTIMFCYPIMLKRNEQHIGLFFLSVAVVKTAVLTLLTTSAQSQQAQFPRSELIQPSMFPKLVK